MRLPVFLVDLGVNDSILFNTNEELLQDLTLKFESAHVPVIGHHCKSIFHYQGVEILIEYCGHHRL